MKILFDKVQQMSTIGLKSEQFPRFWSMSNNGVKTYTCFISGIVRARLKQVGHNSSYLTANSLRRTDVTLLLLAGKNLAEVQQFARHTNIATTMIYNYALDKAKNSCNEAITNAILV